MYRGSMLAFGTCLYLAAFQTIALDWKRTHDIVRAHLGVSTNDDIVQEDFAGLVRSPDLDGDGTDEIVYLRSSYCVQANFDCPNQIVVMTAVTPGKGTARERILHDPNEPKARRTGYAHDVSEQIPGEVSWLEFKRNRIDVTFEVTLDSPICKRYVSETYGRRPTDHCPAPGRYRWAFEWTRGKLTRLPGGTYEKDIGAATFPIPTHDTWVMASHSCEDVTDSDTSPHIKISLDKLEDRGDTLLSQQVELLTQTPWSWRIVTTSSSRPGRTPAVYVVANNQLTVASETHTRHYTRCLWQELDAIKEKRAKS